MRRASPWQRVALYSILVAFAAPLDAAEQPIKITVEAGSHDRANVPVRIMVSLPKEFADSAIVALKDEQGNAWPGQLGPLGVLEQPIADEDAMLRELHLMVPQLKAGETITLTGSIREAELSGETFRWEDEQDKYTTLFYDARPVSRYMHEAVDNSSPQRREETYKVYHHLFDPAGKRLVTKGPGGLFPHHRGIFYAFNKITYGENKKADVWHCRNGESQAHRGILSESVGPLFGRHLAEIDWNGEDGRPFAKEQRQLAFFATKGGTLVDFQSRLVATEGPVKLDGDPQHAGFQFRASQDVPDSTKNKTYYLRPDGKGEPGEFRNWPMHLQHANLPWNALSFVLGDQRYTCVYIDHPKNPKEARYSERDYGRFGSYFEYEIAADKPLDVRYRLWLQEGEMTVEEAEALSANFRDPLKATVTPQ